MSNSQSPNQNLSQTSNQSANIIALIDSLKTLIDVQTTAPTLKQKLKSRKFWMAIALMLTGICSMIGFSDNTIAIITFAIIEIVAVVGYWISEGGIDRKRAEGLANAVIALVEMLGGLSDDPTDSIKQDTNTIDITENITSDK